MPKFYITYLGVQMRRIVAATIFRTLSDMADLQPEDVNFWHSLKVGQGCETREQAKQNVFVYIEDLYNPTRNCLLPLSLEASINQPSQAFRTLFLQEIMKRGHHRALTYGKLNYLRQSRGLIR